MGCAVRRGDVVIVSAPGDFGKPRPAVVVQSDLMRATSSVLVAQMTSEIVIAPLYRLGIDPTPENGLKVPSQVMVPKIIAMQADRIGPTIGRLASAELVALNGMLAAMLGLSG